MSWTLCTSGAAIAKAGANVNTTIIASGTTLANWSDEAEAYACGLARFNVVGGFASLTTNGKQVFQDLTSNLIAQKIIGYQPEALGSSSAATRTNILENNIQRIVKIITEDKNKTYLAIT